MDPINIASAAWRRGLATIGLALGCVLDSGIASGQSQPEPDWSLADMPSQSGRIFLVTGGTSGMGYEDAKALAAAGAQVVIAARNPQRGDEAIARIKQEVAGAQVHFEALDLADLASVQALGERLGATLPRLDGLINNAAIMAPPQRATSADGYESQLATNYLGHFALTAHLLPLLRKGDGARVVTLSSIAAARGSIDFDDLQSERSYNPYAAYAQSKLAGLMFAFELQRRSEARGWGIRSIAAHPGVAVTELIERGPGLDSEFVQRWVPQQLGQGSRALPLRCPGGAADAVRSHRRRSAARCLLRPHGRGRKARSSGAGQRTGRCERRGGGHPAMDGQ